MTQARRRGFRMIELMIAVALVGMLDGMALPYYASARAAAQTLSLRNALLAGLKESSNAAGC